MPEDFGTIKAVTQLEMEGFAREVQGAEEASDGTPLTYAEIVQREQAAKLALKDKLENDELPSWAEKFNRLINEKVPWKIAMFVAWASMPKEMRVPKTLEEFAKEFLGLTSARRVYEWRKKYPGIDTMIANLQGDEFLEGRGDVLETVRYMARQKDYKNAKYADMYLTMTGDLVKTTKLEAFLRQNGYSEDDLKGKPVSELRAMRTQILQQMKEKEELEQYEANQEDAE